MQQIVLTNFVIYDLEHWPIKIGINIISNIQTQRFVAVYSNACG